MPASRCSLVRRRAGPRRCCNIGHTAVATLGTVCGSLDLVPGVRLGAAAHRGRMGGLPVPQNQCRGRGPGARQEWRVGPGAASVRQPAAAPLGLDSYSPGGWAGWRRVAEGIVSGRRRLAAAAGYLAARWRLGSKLLTYSLVRENSIIRASGGGMERMARNCVSELR